MPYFGDKLTFHRPYLGEIDFRSTAVGWQDATNRQAPKMFRVSHQPSPALLPNHRPARPSRLPPGTTERPIGNRPHRTQHRPAGQGEIGIIVGKHVGEVCTTRPGISPGFHTKLQEPIALLGPPSLDSG